MTPSDVLDCQGELLDRLQHNKAFQHYIASALDCQVGGVELSSQDEHHVAGQAFLHKLTDTLRVAYAYQVTADMSMLVQHAGDSLDDSDMFDRSLAPTGCGIVRFETPLKLVDVRSVTMNASWIMWGPVSVDGTAGCAVYVFDDHYTDPDQVYRLLLDNPGVTAERARLITGRWGVVGVDCVPHKMAVGSKCVAISNEVAHRVLEDGNTPSQPSNIIRYVHALWLLLDQTITTLDHDAQDRPSAKRARRMNLPGRVTVVRLRRHASHSHSDGESSVEWQHQWIVRGHWRWQPSGPGRSERHRIWINPHVKGPEGAPLIQSEKVYSLQR